MPVPTQMEPMKMQEEVQPEMDTGRRLLPMVIEQLAAEEPSKIWASIPRSDDLADGFRNITYREFANAIDRAAWWLETVIGRGGHRLFETFAYTGPKDLRYPILAIAAIKIEKKLLLTSPFLSIEGHLHLLDATGCRNYLCADTSIEVIQTLMKAWPRLRQITVPSLSDWLNYGKATPYEYRKSWADAKDDPTTIFHTSGTTGLPRPIIYTNQMMTTFDACHLLPDPEDKLLHHHFENRRVYSPLPSVHVVGMFLALQMTTFWNMTLVMGASSDMPTSSELADKILHFGDVDGVLYPAGLIEDIAQVQPLLEHLLRLKFVAFAGSPLSKGTGDQIAEKTRLVPIIGSTEVGLFTNFVLDSKDWCYYRFHPDMGFEFEPHSKDLYELVLHRKSELVRWQQVFYLNPSLQRYSTHDLFMKHPTIPDAWCFAGRSDDVIMLSNGRLHASPMEMEIQRHKRVQAAVVGGEGRKHPFLILEMTPTEGQEEQHTQRKDLIDEVWPTIQKANEKHKEPFRLRKSLIIIATPEKPLVKAATGLAVRRECVELYRTEIEALYADFWNRSTANFGALGKRAGWARLSLSRAFSAQDPKKKEKKHGKKNSKGSSDLDTKMMQKMDDGKEGMMSPKMLGEQGGMMSPKMSIEQEAMQSPRMGSRQGAMMTPKLGSEQWGMLSPTMGMQSPTMGMQSPTMGMQSPTMGMQSPTMSIQSPMMGMQSPKMGTEPHAMPMPMPMPSPKLGNAQVIMPQPKVGASI